MPTIGGKCVCLIYEVLRREKNRCFCVCLWENSRETESDNQRLIGLGLPLTERQPQKHIYFFGQYSSRRRV